MLDKLIRRADRAKRFGPALRLYLWWGVFIRTVLLAALCTLLIVEGNFLAEWLLSLQIAPSSASDLEEYTAISYVALVLFLAIGGYLRWLLIRRMDAVDPLDDLNKESDGTESEAIG